MAQLVARFHGMEEVRGSNPLSSTRTETKRAPTHSAGRTVPYAFHDKEQPWSGDDLNTVRAERRAPL